MKLYFFTSGLVALTGAQTELNEGENLCPTGTTGDGVTCVDDNECDLGTHDCHATRVCKNVWESFGCICGTGTMDDGDQCVDVDECATGQHDCTTNEACENVWSSFECIEITTKPTTTDTTTITQTTTTTEITTKNETTATTETTRTTGATTTTGTTSSKITSNTTPTATTCNCSCPPVGNPGVTDFITDVTYIMGTTSSNSIVTFVSGLLISIILSI